MRESWDEYFCNIAVAVSSRATCPKLSVGAVLVRNKTIISTGYNGSLHGAQHCNVNGCLTEDGHCIGVIHAEHNAILQAAKNGTPTEFATAYVTHNPCRNCFMALYQAGIKRIVYAKLYKPVNYSVFGLNLNLMPEILQLDGNVTRKHIDNNY
jgi:dCMP deaminase